MRFHLFGLANLPVCKKYTYVPMIPTTWNMAKMLKDHGHHVTLYGAEGSDAPCDEMVTLVPKELIADDLVSGNCGIPVSVWKHAIDSVVWKTFIDNGRRELRKHYRGGDISLISLGFYQRFVVEESILACEFTCGYSGIFHWNKVFPSYAWMHYLYGVLQMERSPNWHDTVIPHYLDLNDFPMQEKKDDYLLFLGRLDSLKGPDIAIDIANRSGSRIIMAGVDMNIYDVPEWLRKLPGNVEFTGYVNLEQRRKLLQGAKALIHPCRWLEPFGNVLIEALACGTPIIASDWGALPEIVRQGVTGFCCRDMEEFVTAVKNVSSLDPHACRREAEEEYSLEVAYPRYMHYFRRLEKQLGEGWFETEGIWRGEEIVSRVAPLQRNGKLLGAEIGVERGVLSSFLLSELPALQLILVDTWGVFPEDSDYAKSGDTITNRTQAQRDDDLVKTLRLTNHAANRRVPMRMRSDEAAPLIQDGSLDFGVLDADHSYPGISVDIELWVRKIRPGGILCGHDYMRNPRWGVTQAVDEYAAKSGLTVERGADYMWFIRIPEAA